jgi:hypothetical protein
VACPGCGRRLFVLPFSPLPPVSSLQAPAPALPAKPAAGKPPRRRWPVALAAGLLALGGLALAVVLALRQAPVANLRERPESVEHSLEAGQKALALGKFRLAVRELENAQQQARHHGPPLSLTRRRQLAQLGREARLLADLLPVSLEEVLRHAVELVALDEDEWQAVFAERYQGRSVVFDAEVRREGGRSVRLGYVLLARGREARIDLDNLELLKRLPLDRPRRLLFGFRLASVRPEPDGVWVVRAQPDSGVLLTDPGAAAACLSREEQELRPVLERQSAWLANSPGS